MKISTFFGILHKIFQRSILFNFNNIFDYLGVFIIFEVFLKIILILFSLIMINFHVFWTCSSTILYLNYFYEQ